MTQSPENIKKALSAVCEYKKANSDNGAEVIGVHSEGPFIAPEHKGAQPLEYVAVPSVEVFDEYNKASGNCIKIVTIAPEREGADTLIKHLSSQGVIASIGHSGAKNKDVAYAISNGAKNVTHTFNAQTALHHREIGVVGSAMLFDELNCEMIADCIHVSVPAMKLLIKSKPLDKLTLITDAMRAKGMPDGESELGGQVVIVKNGEARLKDGVLAGSVLKMNVAIKNLVNEVGVPLTQAVDYATVNPAKTLGIFDSVGSIKVGKKANFAVLDKDFNVLITIRNGKIIYKA
jgi:N-acetylglucosamine-6-phosphate deacetylase